MALIIVATNLGNAIHHTHIAGSNSFPMLEYLHVQCMYMYHCLMGTAMGPL